MSSPCCLYVLLLEILSKFSECDELNINVVPFNKTPLPHISVSCNKTVCVKL